MNKVSKLWWIVIVIMFYSASCAAEDDVAVETSGHRPWGSLVLLTEAFAFGTASISRSDDGARFVGAVDGLSGALILGNHLLGEEDNAGFEIPYAIGLLGMSYYNYANATADSDGKFRSNAIGINTVVAIAALIGISQVDDASKNRVALMFNPHAINMRITF